MTAARTLNALPDAIIAAGPDGAIRAWAGAATSLLGFEAADVLGRPLQWLCRDTGPDRLLPIASLRGAGYAHLVLDLRRKRRRRLRAAVTLTPLRVPEGWGALAQVRPMGPLLEPGEGSRSEWDRAIGRIVRGLLVRLTADTSLELAELLVSQAGRVIPDAECLLSVVPAARQENFEILAGSGPWARRQVGREWPRAGTMAGRAMHEGRSIESVTLMAESALRHILRPGDIDSGRLVPLIAAQPLPDGRQALGVLGFYRSGHRYFTPYERRLIEEFARLVSLALQRSELSVAAAESGARLQLGVEMAAELGASLESRQVVRRLLRRALEIVAADRATLIRIDGGEMVIEDAYDAVGIAAPVGGRFELRDIPAARPLKQALSSRRPVFAGAFETTGMRSAFTGQLTDVKQTLTFPFVLGGEVAAVLVLSRRRDEPFGSDDLAKLQLIGNVAVLALRNAWLFAQAEEASRSKSDFLNMAAHELRTPLTVISGYLSMLTDGTLGNAPPAWERPVATLAAKADELGVLVEDLLLAARLEAGKLPTKGDDEIDLVQVVRDGLRRARPRVELLEGTLGGEVPPAAVKVKGDGEQLGRILDNLVNNALTYSGARPWVRVVLEAPMGSEGGEVRLLVEDRGWGLAEAEWERIFERFYRVEDEEHAHMPGTGLGLYMSRELATRHGGRLELEWSRPGEGSRFVLTLPVAGDPPARVPTPPSPPSGDRE